MSVEEIEREAAAALRAARSPEELSQVWYRQVSYDYSPLIKLHRMTRNHEAINALRRLRVVWEKKENEFSRN